ncbi:uncharacterized protein [Atheta coriaria]|uniref:uncharacterized protein isoform X4 n=1 Tax=Dalotia coriaria TaxID=877792 RepID=UPI0031F3EE67
MRVHWKRLCCLGILFWVCMSGYDYYNGSILVPGEFAKSDLNKVAEGQKEAQFLHSFQTGENLETEWSFWTYALTFLTTNIILVLAVLSRKYYPKRLQTTNEIIATNMAIRAALMDNIDDNTENIVIIHENKYDACPMHKYKAKDENMELMSATKEVVSLNKKLEGLNEEKRNLTRFLAQSEKDNRIIKQKMMEVLRDKNVLLKRLEAATREIRSNTVARQATLGKLEESIQCSNQFKQQIQQMSAEKSELLRRLRQSEAQLKTLRRQTDNKSVNSKSSYNGIKLTSHPKPVDSTKDIEQIEMKLHDLEASLEKMKCKSSEKNEDFESEDNDDTSDSEPKILRQVSSSDMNFLSEVEPSYTNLLGKFDCEPGAGGQQHHQIVESV